MAKDSLLIIPANVILEATLQETSVHMLMIEESQSRSHKSSFGLCTHICSHRKENVIKWSEGSKTRTSDSIKHILYGSHLVFKTVPTSHLKGNVFTSNHSSGDETAGASGDFQRR